jgi:uncharacterized lipoprotein YmbA
MMCRRLRIAALCVLAALAAACASPPSHFYTLTATATPAAAGDALPDLSVLVGPVSIPAIVDLPQIVVTTGPNQVTLDEFQRWASPLADNVARVVADDLVAILGTPHVSLFQQSLNASAAYRAAIEVNRFESMPGEAAVLDAVWLVRRTKDGTAVTGRTTVREATRDASYAALAEAHSRALARLSRDLAATIRALARSAP